jgi:muramoyltetrapeptide carboxypeptidase
MHLKLAGKFDGVRGVIFGEMLKCGPRDDEDFTLQQVVQRVLSDLGIPIAYGLKSGHVSRGNVTLPFGVRAQFTAGTNGSLRVDASVRHEQANMPLSKP